MTDQPTNRVLPDPASPIGVFDSGVGGLSILRHILQQLPHENLLYLADSGYAPYGEKSEKLVIERSLAIAQFLLDSGCKALVVACNTATAAAIKLLRDQYPQIPIVGVEPGLKPAAVLTASGTVGVLATERTLSSDKFRQLRDQLAATTGVRFLSQPCNGLADLIEHDELDSTTTVALIERLVAPLVAQQADTLVLGCTHYPFAQQIIRETAIKSGSKSVQIIDTGEPVARQLARLLAQHRLENPNAEAATLTACTTGEPAALSAAFDKLLQKQPHITQVAV
ncbi:MAG: glutamate racemase [Burkholderiaceae bacterium]|nr:glutamate racemase [Burkholderiaceae bacterium]